LLTCGARASCIAADAALADQNHRSGILELRAGHTEASYGLLEKAYRACPEEPRFRNDFIVVAVDADHGKDALAIAAALDWRLLPAYVLNALGRAARDTRQAELALRYYDASLAQTADPGAQVGRDLALIDAHEARQARADLILMNQSHPGRIDVLEALGLADEALDQVTDALAAAEQILQHDPHHVGAQQLRFRMLVRGGAPQLALKTTAEILIARKERDAARRDQLVFEFRWARDDPATDLVRAMRMDAVIQRMRAVLAEPELDRDARAGLRGDLVEALSARGRASEAVAEYESMRDDHVATETYVTAAAADAYLAQKRPEQAILLYESLPSESDLSYGIRADYFYALLEAEHYDRAVEWADEIALSEPMYRYANYPGLRTDNADFGHALVLAALARTYTDRPIEGQARLESILRTAPADADARLALAQNDASRGWPRTAALTANENLLDDPDSTAPLSQIFADQLAMGDWRGAYGTLTQMKDRLPSDNAALLRAERDWETHEMAEFSVDASFGTSYGGRSGVIDSQIDGYLYSSPFLWDYRAYVHVNATEGDPVQGDTYRHALGAGIEYHTQDWLGTAELLEINSAGVYPEFSLESTPDDYWKIGGSYAVRTLDIPIAAVVVGVHADRLDLNLEYRVSEARAFGTQLVHETYSDGNLRSEWLGYWTERWITGPVYKLDTRVDLGTSQNTLADTNYFNPRSDVSAAITFENQWLQFRHYDTSLTHELDIGVGDYVQQGYGAGSILLARYQVTYAVNDRLTLRAGIGATYRPFDGQRERLDVVTLNITGRF